MTPGRAALVALMRRYLSGLMDPSVSLLEVHKLMYFMQEAGEPLRLDFAKAPYGPYAENLRHVLRKVEGHFISGYAPAEDAPDTPLEVLPPAGDDAEAFLAGHPSTRQRLERVASLVEGFESPFGLELLSTVHWVATREGATTPERAVERTFAWGERKLRFSEDQVRLSLSRLRELGWLAVASPVEGENAG